MLNQTVPWQQLSAVAWEVRNNAYLFGKTAVGAAVLSAAGNVYAGCNIEHAYRCHDIHAEISAVTAMISGGEQRLTAILIAAEREKFTPCGGCMDWIMQHGGPECRVAYQAIPGGPVTEFAAGELMPHYPA